MKKIARLLINLAILIAFSTIFVVIFLTISYFTDDQAATIVLLGVLYLIVLDREVG